MKVKIQIKSYIGSVLFEAEKEDYTIKRALQDAVLRGADLQGAVLRGAVLQDADLRGAVLRGAVLQDAVLRGADLQGAVLRGAVLQGAVLRGAVLQGAVLQDADLQGADLRGADLQGAVLRGAVLQDAVLRGADLQGAVLRGAVLQDADLQGAVLRGAKIESISDLGDYTNQCSRDMLFVFQHLKDELPGLRTALAEGRIDGTQYEGDCACLIGTLAKLDGGMNKVCKAIPYYEKGLNNYCEQWFWNIHTGDIPETNLFAAHALKLIDMVLEGEK